MKKIYFYIFHLNRYRFSLAITLAVFIIIFLQGYWMFHFYKKNFQDSSIYKIFKKTDLFLQDLNLKNEEEFFKSLPLLSSEKEIEIPKNKLKQQINSTCQVEKIKREKNKQIEIQKVYKIIHKINKTENLANINWGILDKNEQKIYLEENIIRKNYFFTDFLKMKFNTFVFENEKYAIFPYFEKELGINTQQKSFIIVLFLNFLLLFFILLANFIFQSKFIQIDELKYNIMNNISHELQTPITHISMASEFILIELEKLPGTNKNRLIDTIKKHLNELQITSKNLIDANNLRVGLLKVEKKIVDLTKILEIAAEKLRNNLELRNGKIRFNYNKNQHYWIKGDSEYLQQVFVNLLDNAIKYSPDRVIIDLNIEKKLKYWILEIKDQGIGIPKQAINNVFDRLYRVPTADVHNNRGMGLGLSYVRDILDLHQTQISIKSKIGEGTTIIIKFKAYESF